MPDLRLPIQRRSLQVDHREAYNPETRTLSLVASTEETIVPRWWGREQLMHGDGNIRMGRAQSEAGIPLLWGHDAESMECLLGRVTDFRLDKAGKCTRAKAVFATTEEAERAIRLIQDGALRDVSIGYFIHEVTSSRKAGEQDELLQVTDWEPAEVSLVSVPADPAAGIGRQATEYPVRMVRSDESTTLPAAQPVTTEVPMEPNTPTVAAPAADPEAQRSERLEVLNLQAIAERNGLGKEARELLSSSKPLAEIRHALLGLVADRSAAPLPAPVVDMSQKEAREYSYARAIQNLLARSENIPVARSFEDEVHESLEKSMPKDAKRNGGLLVPLRLRTAGSTMDSITTYAGTETKFTEYGGELIDLLRAFTTVIQSGARVYNGLLGPVSFPKITADATISWVAENPGSDMSATAPTFGSVTLSPKTMAGAIPYSRQLLQQSVISIEAEVRRNLAVGHALAIDRAAIHGSGASNQPTGIYKTSGVNTKAMGGAVAYGELIDMITEVDKDNALMDALAFLTTPGMAGKLAQTLTDATYGAEHIWKGPRRGGQVCGYLANSTNQVSSVMSTLDVTGGSEHGIIFGNWADLMIGFWGALELVVDPYSLKKQQLIEVASFQMGDIQIRHPQSFCVATGATI